MTISTYALTRTGSATPVPLTVTDVGQGRPVLLLHGGGGPQTVLPFGALLAAEHPARVLTPTHPGWNGTPRPDDLTDVRGLAATYLALLDALDLTGVTVVGNSIGGWIAAELALLGGPRIDRAIIINGVGIEVPGHPVADFFALTPAGLADLSHDDPDRFRLDPATLPAAQRAVMAANRQTIERYAGRTMQDPTLAERLSGVRVPVCVLWGQSDRIVDAEYGKAYAAAIPGARYEALARTGHLPQLESPDRTVEAVWSFVTADEPR